MWKGKELLDQNYNVKSNCENSLFLMSIVPNLTGTTLSDVFQPLVSEKVSTRPKDGGFHV